MEDENHFFMEAEIDGKKDVILFNKQFRDVLETHLGAECADTFFRRVIGIKMTYPYKQLFRLVCDRYVILKLEWDDGKDWSPFLPELFHIVEWLYHLVGARNTGRLTSAPLVVARAIARWLQKSSWIRVTKFLAGRPDSSRVTFRFRLPVPLPRLGPSSAFP